MMEERAAKSKMKGANHWTNQLGSLLKVQLLCAVKVNCWGDTVSTHWRRVIGYISNDFLPGLTGAGKLALSYLLCRAAGYFIPFP